MLQISIYYYESTTVNCIYGIPEVFESGKKKWQETTPTPNYLN